MNRVNSLQEAKDRYGEIANGAWANEAKWMVVIKIPDSISQTWINVATKLPTKKIYVNKDLSQPLLNALNNILNRGLLTELHTFDGCFCIRDVRALPGHPSTHSWGLAIDINAKENPLNAIPVLSNEFIKCFTDEGFIWGGNFTRKDGMHFQYASGF